MRRRPQPIAPIRADSPAVLLRPLAALACVILIGTLGFMITENGWSFWRALYFTLITITTVGYDDHGITGVSQGLAAVLILLGIGTCTYALGQVVQFAVGTQLAWRQKMQRHIDRLEDHFIICGLGRVGRAICERFHEAAMPVVVIERNAERAAWAREKGHMAVEGSATEDEVLHMAGVERARGIVCATSCDAENLATTLTARELNPDIVIISRADDPRSKRKFERAGATHVVSPATNGGHDIATMLIRPHLAGFLQRARASESGYQLTEIVIEINSPLVDGTVEAFSARERGIVIVAIQSAAGHAQLRPDPSVRFGAGDVVILAGELDAIVRMSELAKGRLAAAG